MKPHRLLIALLPLASSAGVILHAQDGTLKPSWMLTGDSFADPAKPAKVPHAYPLAATKSGKILFKTGGTNGDPSLGVVLVDGATGTIVQRSRFGRLPDGHDEWISSHTTAPDGRIVLCSVAWHYDAEPNAKMRRALVNLRAVDPETGKITTHTKMAFDNPESDAESGPVIWIASGCAPVANIGGTIAVATPYCVAELSPDLSKIARFVRLPQRVSEARLMTTGASWHQNSSDGPKPVFMATFGGAVEALPVFKPGWKATWASAGPAGLMMIQSKSDDGKGKEEALGAYDPAKKSWRWSKEGEGWLGGLDFRDDLNTPWMTISARSETLIVDATGATRYKHPRRARIEIRPDGKALVIDGQDILLVNCAIGAVDAQFTLPRKPTYDSVVLALPSYKYFFADQVDGVIEISVADGKAKTLSAPHELALDLPEGIKLQDPKARIRYGKLSGIALPSGAVLSIPCEDRKTVFCAVPLPSK